MDHTSSTTIARRVPFERNLATIRRVPLLLYGILAFCFGTGMYLLGILMVFPRYILGLNTLLLPLNEWIVWHSGMPIMLGFALGATDLLLFLPARRAGMGVRHDPIPDPRVTVALTAYNDELSIAAAVQDFRAHPLVKTVIVVSNNSSDDTLSRAAGAGAVAINEPAQGYGRCVYRCMQEAIAFDDTELIVLCEGDRTFRASDLDKFLAYAPHADIVNGTRTVERLRQHTTQLSTFMYYGNLFVGKMLEAKHLGRCTVTDVGTTYKLCSRSALSRLLPVLNPEINLEFNAFFLDKALETGLSVVECPITFHPRVGLSKGGNVDNLRALKVGCRMVLGILLNWRLGHR